ncbi:ADP-binding protein [Acholeplasma oculi]|uniref:tRNA threonylcarbamoyladenosine biosynthesis protein TsaE n=1 Tax=Acholeplasma oculi TaxID=35623 RepID=A0A061A9N2_9MOLU|nr:tRNA (adenosine(37)-N6)-threonylcarbamoyltransferase complex ATPase subunit type 1 TsaE [Acholeplasma oculi]CDR30109.1 tRNA threonylcarbamoyl adenosine modification protein TsaE [Acholeplasma oculi]SKC44752.1 tRNA threonylcarbamoyladenosine biosynthesis protein TsaE [Acholeplasma oculi]SUT88406.1 ADP-binding protein [Acholeplasma oculi]
MKTFITNSKEETIELGYRLMEKMPKDMKVILLNGDLSSGKTTFTKGIAKALGIKQIVNSPTFTILKIYQGDKTLYHLDLYRMHDVGTDFDLEEYINDRSGVAVIEWPHQVDELLPLRYVEVDLTWLDENQRKIEIKSIGDDGKWVLSL